MQKAGFTLTELLAVMTALFAVMGISVVLLVQTLDFQHGNSVFSDRICAADRLVADFRNDIHAYGQPEIPADGALLRWKTETITLDYVIEPGKLPDQSIVVRTLQKDGQKFCETYRLPDKTTVWCVDGKETDTGLVALSLWTMLAPGMEMPPLETLNPFDRTFQEKSQVNLRYAGNWRTIIARYNKE